MIEILVKDAAAKLLDQSVSVKDINESKSAQDIVNSLIKEAEAKNSEQGASAKVNIDSKAEMDVIETLIKKANEGEGGKVKRASSVSAN